MGNSFEVFVSYLEDTGNSYAEKICDILSKRRNRKVFVAHIERPSHSYNFETYVDEAIDSCKVFILILTMDIFESNQVIREVKRIIERGICEGCLWIFRFDDRHIPRTKPSFTNETKLDPNINQHDFRNTADLGNLLLIQHDDSLEVCFGGDDDGRKKISPYEIAMTVEFKEKQAKPDYSHASTWKDEKQFKFYYAEGIDIDSKGNIYVADEGNHVRKFDNTGKLILEWGSKGTEDGQFTTAYAVAIDSKDYIHVSDEGGRIQKFDSKGTFIMKWGTSGTENGQFSSPFGVAVDKRIDHIYVSEETNNRIQKFDSKGTFIMKWGTEGIEDGQFNHPIGTALDSQGNVYVADYLNHRIQKFDCNGNFIMKWGEFGKEIGNFDHPHGITLNSSDLVYVSDSLNGRIQIFTANGIILTSFGKPGDKNGELNVPRDLAVDSTQKLFVSDGSNHRIQVFIPSDDFKKICFASKSEIDFYIDKIQTMNESSYDIIWRDLEHVATKKYIWNDERIWSLISKEIEEFGKYVSEALDLLKRMITGVNLNSSINGVAMRAKNLYLTNLIQILENNEILESKLRREKEKIISKQIIDLIAEEQERFKIYWAAWKKSAIEISDANLFMKNTGFFINDIEYAKYEYKEEIKDQIYELIDSKNVYVSQRAKDLKNILR